MTLRDLAIYILGAPVPALLAFLMIGCRALQGLLDYWRKREIFRLYHVERMAAIEKGASLPPLPADFFGEARGGRRLRN